MVSEIRPIESSRLSRTTLLQLHRLMVTSRLVDEAERNLRRQGHSHFQMNCAGHEGVQAAATLSLRPGSDWFYPYYRDRTVILGLGVPARDVFLLSMGKASDPSSGGRQMPHHYGNRPLNIVSQSSPTGTQYLQAVGTAEVARIAAQSPRSSVMPVFRDDEVVYVSGGEGSTSEGEFYEAISAAVIKRLPVLFLIQDNEYAISVPVEEQTPAGSISQVFQGCPGLLVKDVDGTDVLASHTALEDAVKHCRSGRGPALVHAKVARLGAHSDSDDDSAYRTEAEKRTDLARDPVSLFEARLLEAGLVTNDGLETIRSTLRGQVRLAADSALQAADPTAESVTRFIFDDDAPAVVETEPARVGPPRNMIQAINRTLEVEMGLDPRVVIFGEDVADCSRQQHLDELKGKGGVFGATKNLQRLFGSHRVFNSPLAEASIVGRAVGMAVRGLRPVVEIQFVDFIWPAMQQIRSELALMRWRSNNVWTCPVVVRAPAGGYVRGGAIYHSQTAESIFSLCPGLHVAMPSNARDAAGLLRTAIRSDDPVLFLEHKHLYRQSYARAPDPGENYVVPFGKAKVVRDGKDVTVVTYGSQVQRSLEAAERVAERGTDVEVIDLRSLVPWDWETVAASVRKTGRLCVVYEEMKSFGFGAEIAARAAHELFEHLDAPVGRLGGQDVHIGYHPTLIEASLPTVDGIEKLIDETVRY